MTQALQPVHELRFDRHAPLVAVVLVLGIQRERARRGVSLLVDDLRSLGVLLERRGADRRAALHRVVLLRGRQRIVVAGLHELEAAAEPGRVRGAQQERVELLRSADGVADASGVAAAVAEEHRHRLRRMSGDDEHRHAHGVAAIAQLDQVAFPQAALLGEPRADPRRRVPGDLGIRLRQLLEPAVVREAAVPDRRDRGGR